MGLVSVLVSDGAGDLIAEHKVPGALAYVAESLEDVDLSGSDQDRLVQARVFSRAGD